VNLDEKGINSKGTSSARSQSERDENLTLTQYSSSGHVLSNPLMVARLAPNLNWIAATPILQQFLGQSISSLLTTSFLKWVHPDDVTNLTLQFEDVLKQGEGHNITFRVQIAGGMTRHLQMDVYVRHTDAGAPMHLRCHFLDITEQVTTAQKLSSRTDDLFRTNERLRQTNAALERLKESYRDLYNQTPVYFFSLDLGGFFVACNDTMLRALGYTREELIGQDYDFVLSDLGRQQLAANPEFYKQAGEAETQWIRKDGTILDVWTRTTTQVDEKGRFERSRSAALDVTERTRLAKAVQAKAEEIEKAHVQLLRINQELEEFTHVVSHDLKEPLRTLQTFSGFLAQDYGAQLGPEGLEQIQYLMDASSRLGLLIDDLLNLSRAGRVMHAPRTFDLGQALETVKGDLADLITRSNAVVHVVELLPEVMGDPDRIMQLLANLIGNGLKYNRSATPEITISAVKPKPGGSHSGNGISAPTPPPAPKRWGEITPIAQKPVIEEDQEALSGDHVTLFVRDNGIGIDRSYHEQVFRIFRRLHHREEYEGTGAGLAICKKIVEAHGGRIWLESEPGKGSTFYFTLAKPPSSRLAPRVGWPELCNSLCESEGTRGASAHHS
jgi:PAS domain S-box-containing protein